MAGNVACKGEMRNAYRILGRKSKEKMLLGRLRNRWGNNIKIEIGREGVD
jgi:hypothetical protein